MCVLLFLFLKKYITPLYISRILTLHLWYKTQVWMAYLFYQWKKTRQFCARVCIYSLAGDYTPTTHRRIADGDYQSTQFQAEIRCQKTHTPPHPQHSTHSFSRYKSSNARRHTHTHHHTQQLCTARSDLFADVCRRFIYYGDAVVVQYHSRVSFIHNSSAEAHKSQLTLDRDYFQTKK